MKGIGIDLCSISRIQKAEELTGKFFEKYYTDSEREYIQSRNQAGMQSAAAMFAAKEAFLKAIGTGISAEVHLHDVEVLHNENGAPSYRLNEKASKKMHEIGASQTFLSITHEGDTAAAVCILV